MSEVKLSLCMIVKDEEEALPGCLESVRGLVDEIIVVDTGSRDRTPEIAKKYGAKVFSFKWINDFAAARNESLRHATGDYIFWLDADDRLPEEEREKFSRWRDSLPRDGKKAYYFTVECPERGEDFFSRFANQVRAFPNLPEVQFVRRIHESVIESLQVLGIPIEESGVRIFHAGYSDPEIIKRKAKRNLKMLLTALAENPNDAVIHWHLSMTYGILGNHRKALQHAKKFLQEGKLKEEWEIAAILNVARCHCHLKEWNKAEQMYIKALEKAPDDPMALFLAAGFYLERGREEEALKLLEHLKETGFRITRVPFPVIYAKYLAHLWLGNLYSLRGDEERALEEYLEASRLSPKGELRGKYALLGEAALRRGDIEKAKEFLELAKAEDPLNPDVLSNLGIVYRRLSDMKRAEECFREALKVDPSHFEALSNLGHLLLSMNRTDEACGVFLKALEEDLQAEDLHLGLSLSYALEGKIEEMIPHCRSLLISLEQPIPEVVESLSDLARLYEEIGEALRERGRKYEAYLALRTAKALYEKEALVSA